MEFTQWEGRRFYLFGAFLRKHFPFRVRKITLDAGFTCPNIDGKLATGGCIYCNNRSFSPAVNLGIASIREQIQRFKSRQKEGTKFLAYFQAYSNTYAPVDQLKSLYDTALEDEDVIGLDISTRPDCVEEPVLDLIESYARDRMVWLEYGLQSASNRVLKKINRAHRVEDFVDAVERTKGRGIYICAHVILGFPWESREEMLESVRLVSRLGVDGIKIHHLYVAKDTVLERAYRKGKVPVLDWQEYLPLICDAIELLGENMVIHRLTGDLRGDFLVAPKWGLGTGEIYHQIQQELERRGTYQGYAYAGAKG